MSQSRYTDGNRLDASLMCRAVSGGSHFACSSFQSLREVRVHEKTVYAEFGK